MKVKFALVSRACPEKWLKSHCCIPLGNPAGDSLIFRHYFLPLHPPQTPSLKIPQQCKRKESGGPGDPQPTSHGGTLPLGTQGWSYFKPIICPQITNAAGKRREAGLQFSDSTEDGCQVLSYLFLHHSSARRSSSIKRSGNNSVGN